MLKDTVEPFSKLKLSLGRSSAAKAAEGVTDTTSFHVPSPWRQLSTSFKIKT